MKKIKTMILLLVAAIAIGIGTTGCGSSLSDRSVIEETESLALDHRHDLGDYVDVKIVKSHFGKIFCFIASCVNSDFPSCDEAWKVRITSTEWKTRDVWLIRRGSNYYLHYW